MIDVVRYTPEHMKNIKLRECHDNDAIPTKIQGDAVTVIADGNPIAIFTGFSPSPGVFHISAFISDLVKKYPIAFHRTCLGLSDRYKQILRARRLQMHVREDNPVGYRWAKALGFEMEGLLRHYGPDGCNHWIFGRTD